MTHVSLDRFKRLTKVIHEELLKHEDGLTTYEVYKATNLPRGMVLPILQDNLLFYVDRWQKAHNRSDTCVWMAVPINNPGDCPRPDTDE